MKRPSIAACAMLLTLSAGAGASAAEPFVIRSTDKTPDVLVAAIKTYAEQKKWQYLGESKVNKGQVRLVKICIPEVGQLIWPIGLQLSALLPCGNVGIYLKGAMTELSLLHPRYMAVLYPHPATERASTIAESLLIEMVDAVAQ